MLNNGNPYAKHIANKYVPVHLEEMGYNNDEIKEAHYVEPKHLINEDFYHGHYMVISIDEPDTTYYYGITKKGKKVIQFCEKDRLLPNVVTDRVRTETKHSEENCVSYLENRIR